MRSRLVSNLLGLIGGVLGGGAGYYLFGWAYRQNFYAMVVPGAMLGLGSGLLARHRSTARGVACALAAVGLGLFTEWKFFPFRADDSLGYLLAHVYELQPLTLIMVGAGAFVAYWTGRDAMLGVADGPPRPGPGPAEGR